VTARAPAKVNLQLSVGAARPDGYHDVVTVYQAVSLWDEVVATPAPGEGVSVTVAGPYADGVPTDRHNLAARAALALAAEAGVAPDVRLHVRKDVPVAAGMAGGSADAAAALVACEALWGLGLDRAALLEVAAGLGSDVPFALLGGVAVGTGRGERLSPALVSGTLHWVLAVESGGLSTPDVYAEVDRLRGDAPVPGPALSEPLLAALRGADPRAVSGALSNDMADAAVALRPSLRRTLDAGLDAGALASMVSGSGPTCALLAEDEAHAGALAVALSDAGVCRTVLRVSGPVPGARVVAASPTDAEAR
jgi:4-diphosphocytidyl-2-C-methyl-D-erythritol kinase